MQYAPHALLNCVAWFSLLAYGNAARGIVPSEVLSHFAHTVGTVLVPTLANEIHGARANRSATHKPQQSTETAQRRQLDTRQISPQDSGNPGIGPASPGNVGPVSPNGFHFPGPQQAFGPYQYERAYQYRYPGFNQQLQQNFFPGGGAQFNGLPIDPRFFQQQLGGNPGLAPIQSDIPKPLSANINANAGNNNLKQDNGNANSVQNLDSNGDSKSSAQSRPFDGQDFSTIPVSPNQGAGVGPGLDPSSGNLRVNNRFAAIDYERVRQNYYSDPPVNQQRDYFSFNEIPFSSGAGGSPYRSPLSERYSNLNYNAAGGQQAGGPSSELRSGNGLGDPYFGSFFQGPYQSLGYNSLPGGGSASSIGTGGNAGPAFSEDLERGGGPSNFRSPFGGGLQYPADFNGAFFPGTAGGAGFGGGDSPLRASATKESRSQASASRNTPQKQREDDAEDADEDRESVDGQQARYVSGKLQSNEDKKEESTTRRA